MEHEIRDQATSQIGYYLKVTLNAALYGLPFMEQLDLWIKIGSTVAGITLSIFLIRNAIQAYRLGELKRLLANEELRHKQIENEILIKEHKLIKKDAKIRK
jgi:hypothetical protein